MAHLQRFASHWNHSQHQAEVEEEEKVVVGDPRLLGRIQAKKCSEWFRTSATTKEESKHAKPVFDLAILDLSGMGRQNIS